MLRPPESFVTARLSARPVTAADAPEIFAAYASDREVTRFLAWKAYSELPPLVEFLKASEETWRTGQGHFAWLLRLRSSQEAVGSIGLSINRHHVVFGYVLGRKHWGQGLMAEPLRWLVDWSMAQPGISRAWAFCDTENPSSARVMEKAGMQREGILRRWHVCPSIGPEARDCIVCARVR